MTKVIRADFIKEAWRTHIGGDDRSSKDVGSHEYFGHPAAVGASVSGCAGGKGERAHTTSAISPMTTNAHAIALTIYPETHIRKLSELALRFVMRVGQLHVSTSGVVNASGRNRWNSDRGCVSVIDRPRWSVDLGSWEDPKMLFLGRAG